MGKQLSPSSPQTNLFTNSFLKEVLRRREHLSVLEGILSEKIHERRRLGHLHDEGRLNFGSIVPKEQLLEEAYQVKHHVDETLGTADLLMPRVAYFSIWDRKASAPLHSSYALSAFGLGYAVVSSSPSVTPLLRFLLGAGSFCILIAAALVHFDQSKSSSYHQDTIILQRKERTELVGTIAHEYVHYILEKRREQQGIKKPGFFDSPFSGSSLNPYLLDEGLAEGISRMISSRYQQLENNEAFQYGRIARDVDDLEEVCQWLSGKKYGLARGKLSNHALGNALFLLYERLKGPKIYREVLEGKNPFS